VHALATLHTSATVRVRAATFITRMRCAQRHASNATPVVARIRIYRAAAGTYRAETLHTPTTPTAAAWRWGRHLPHTTYRTVCPTAARTCLLHHHTYWDCHTTTTAFLRALQPAAPRLHYHYYLALQLDGYHSHLLRACFLR